MWLGERRHPGIQTSNSFFSLVAFLPFQKVAGRSELQLSGCVGSRWIPSLYTKHSCFYPELMGNSVMHGELKCSVFVLSSNCWNSSSEQDIPAVGALDHIIWADLKRSQQWLSNFQVSVANTVLWWFCKPVVKFWQSSTHSNYLRVRGNWLEYPKKTRTLMQIPQHLKLRLLERCIVFEF